MKNFILVTLCGWMMNATAQNVGIGTVVPTERLHVTQTGDVNKNVIFGSANQNSGTSDFQNTGVAGFGQGNGVTGGFGYGFGIKGIGSTNSYGAVGVYAGLSTAVPAVTLGNRFYALYADAGTVATNRYAGVFLNGNVGIGIVTPAERLDVAGNIQASGFMEAASHTFSTPKTYYYSICGSDDSAKSSGTQVDKETISGGGFYISGGTGSLTAPVHLPHGAVVTKMTVYFLDNSPGVDVRVALRRNTSTVDMGLVFSNLAPGESSASDNTIGSATIDNSLYAYTLDISAVGSFWPDVSLVVRRIVIDYTVTSL